MSVWETERARGRVRLQIKGASEKEKESGVSYTGRAVILLAGFIPAVRDVTNRGGGREE